MEKKKNKIFYIILLIVIILLIIYNVYKIIFILYNDNKNEDLIENIIEEVKIETPVIDNEDKEELLTYYDIPKLKNMNSDTIGWIEVEGTNINYPLVQTTDNEYYLNYSFDKSRNINGWVFMNYKNNSNLGDTNTIIFGHNTMFKALRDKYNSHNNSNFNINIYLEGVKYVYEAFSLYLTDPYNVEILEKNISSDVFNSMVKSSSINFGVSASLDDKIITLSTCYYDDSNRIIVHGKLIDIIKIES